MRDMKEFCERHGLGLTCVVRMILRTVFESLFSATKGTTKSRQNTSEQRFEHMVQVEEFQETPSCGKDTIRWR